MGGYDYITVRAPLWLSHCGEKGVARKGCLKRAVPSHSVDDEAKLRLEFGLCQQFEGIREL
jgi:hypothetical protein